MSLEDGVKAYIVQYATERNMELSEDKIHAITVRILDSVADSIDLELEQLL